MARKKKVSPRKKFDFDAPVETSRDEPLGVRMCTIKVPMVEEILHGYRARHAEFRLTSEQAEKVRCVLEGLQRSGTKLKSGKEILRTPDVLRYLIDSLPG